MYIVTEVQINESNTVSILNDNYTGYNQAVNKYHTVLAAAALSNVDRHSAFLYTEDGYMAHEIFQQDAINATPIFIVIELQINQDNTMAAIDHSFTDYNQALSCYYTVLGSAAISNVYKHACFMMTPESFSMHECFTHVPAPVEPEEEPEEQGEEPEEPEVNEGE